MNRALTVVAAHDLEPAAVETVAQRIRALQVESRRLATEHAAALAATLAALHAMSTEIVGGGEAYPVGIRAIARDIVLTCERQGPILNALNGRPS